MVSRSQPSSDVADEIRTALAMREAGYQVLFDHVTSAELLRMYDEMRAQLAEHEANEMAYEVTLAELLEFSRQYGGCTHDSLAEMIHQQFEIRRKQ